ncbi:Hypothetical predicted protein [Paramuricea clavata]|uniref:Uncharacterized protein n=1 Tax=Paramuricea clavata TaxID=317549 RepID=A0A7D9EZT4_PARCT|nr:Hypothetical predicted protein [Paramuricea clavata]
MAEDLTHEIEAIDKLIQIGKLQNIAFEREHFMLNKQVVNPRLPFQTFRNGLKGKVKPLEGREKQRFLNLAANLRSALDRLCRLIYRHCNNGSNSTEAENVKFPSKVPTRSDNAQKEAFAQEHFNITFTDNTDMSAYDRFEAIILGCFGVDEQADRILKTLHGLCNLGESVVIEVKQQQANWAVTFRSNSDEFYMQPEPLIKFASKLLPFVKHTRNNLLEGFPTAAFDDNKVRHDAAAGVHVGTGHCKWPEFDQMCLYNNLNYMYISC